MKKPPNPRLVLAVAVLLAGMGAGLNHPPGRGPLFVLFVLPLGAFTLKTAAPEVSFIGKVSGGLFVWAMAAFDAYKTARIRSAVWAHKTAAR